MRTHNRTRTVTFAAIICAVTIAVPPSQARDKAPTPVQAVRAMTAVKIDGVLDDAVWQAAPVYSLQRSVNDVKTLPKLQEKGTVRFAWDDQFLYMAVDFQDSDIVAFGKADNEYHFATGDVAELFLKPADQPAYWELYATPHSMKTSLFIKSRGYMGLPNVPDPVSSGMQVAARCQGTLNNGSDRDQGWTAEMAFPRADLERTGAKFGPDQKWKIFTGRYNYGMVFDDGPELSMFPQLPATNYHLTRFYGILQLLPAPGM